MFWLASSLSQECACISSFVNCYVYGFLRLTFTYLVGVISREVASRKDNVLGHIRLLVTRTINLPAEIFEREVGSELITY